MQENMNFEEDDELEKLHQRYVIDDKWRAAWNAKSYKADYGRLCSVQEYIDKRAQQANLRIAALIEKVNYYLDIRRSA